MAENFANLIKHINLHIHKLNELLVSIPKSSTPRHIIIKLSKDNEKILKAVREKKFIMYISHQKLQRSEGSGMMTYSKY